MFIHYFKGEPNVHIVRYKNGQVVAHGDGINFWYLPLTTSIAAVPTASQEAQFLFTESTCDYQDVSIQGTLVYRIVEPLAVASRLNFTIEPATRRYQSDDPDKLVQRVVNAVQAHVRKSIIAMSLEDALQRAPTLAGEILDAVVAEATPAETGIVLEGLHFTAVRPSPEMRKALEADYRESLQQRADKAIFMRRAAAIEQEREIRESELGTEVELENRRQELVDTQARNNLTLAEADARADEMKLNPYASMPPQALVALALKEWAGNAGNIENLSITPDLLTKVANWASAGQH